MEARSFFILTIQLSMFLFGLSSSLPIVCHEDERSALLEFKKSFFNKSQYLCYPHTKIETWKLEAGSGNCCAWDGIECDKNTGYIIGVELSDSCLSGSITSNTTLFHLVHLQKLNLSQNSLSGQVPPQILRLTNLLSLDLSLNYEWKLKKRYSLKLRKPNLLDLVQNLTKLENLCLDLVNISAPVPDTLANTLSLRSLKLADCNLQGEFPSAIFKMPNLELLDVSSNEHLSGHLPEFHWRSSLKSLWLSYTNFSGKLPSSLGNLASLTEVILPFNNFIGQIPLSLGNLTQLTRLSLSENQLMGEIPFSIRNLTKLAELDLGGNQLTGVLPSWMGLLSNLVYLDLSSNKLAGEVPSSFINLTQLTHLDLHLNQLRGQILPHLTKIIHLEFIDLSFNHFSGSIPSSITKIKNLNILDIYSNNFKGTVHSSMISMFDNLFKLQLSFNDLSLVDDVNITDDDFAFPLLGIVGLASCNLSSFPGFLRIRESGLVWVDLSYNHICGEIPEWFLNTNIDTLQTLNLSSNLLTSSLHEPIKFRWKALYTMDLRHNNLEGSLPIPPKTIEFYLVSKNNFSRELPPQMCELSKVKGVDLGENNFTGILPQCLNNLGNTLSFLSLRGNNLHGEIHSLFSNGDCSLRMLDLSSNRFQGLLPRSLANCYELEFLNLGSNRFNDVFPFWLGSLTNLRVLILHSNEFHGPIGEPKFSDDFASLQIIDLSSNNFSRCLPSKYFECWKAMKFPRLYHDNYMGGPMLPHEEPVPVTNGMYDYSTTIIIKGIKMAYPKIQNYLIFVDLSSNNFTCEIPGAIGSLVEVQFLNFSNNRLNGTIPSFLKALTKLQALDLSRNELRGMIPEELVVLNFLGTFNVSYNNLSGRIPEGRQFDTFNNDSYLGNAELCGLPLSKKCNDDQKLPQPQSKGEGEESIEVDWIVALMGYAGGLVIGVLIGQSFTIQPPCWILKFFCRRAYHILYTM